MKKLVFHNNLFNKYQYISEINLLCTLRFFVNRSIGP